MARVDLKASLALDADEALARLRLLAARLPEVVERPSNGMPTWYAKRRSVAVFADDYRGDGRVAVWLRVAAGDQRAMLELAGAYFRPSFVGRFNWIGIDLRRAHDGWEEVAELFESSWRQVANGFLVLQFDRDRELERADL